MTTLDSRALRYLDCFAQTFTTPGRVTYRLLAGTGVWAAIAADDEDVFTITITEGKRKDASAKGAQHDVTVRRSGQRLVAEPPQLTIAAGDIVGWHAPDTATPGFVVIGEGAGGMFNSAALASGAIYTHVFDAPGDYQWGGANDGQTGGIVHVRNVEARTHGDLAEWLETLNNGTLVTIKEGQASPREVQIVVGQTVFFAVEQASGVTVTDARLVKER